MVDFAKEIEEWRSVVGAEGLYEVSSFGSVRSVDRTIIRSDGQARRYKGKALAPGLSSNGYPSVVIRKGHTHMVHELVAKAFIGPCPQGMEVRHKDGVRINPRADNLEYGTRLKNIEDALRHGSWHSERRVRAREKIWKLRKERHGERGGNKGNQYGPY